jgi:hypothetical protein
MLSLHPASVESVVTLPFTTPFTPTLQLSYYTRFLHVINKLTSHFYANPLVSPSLCFIDELQPEILHIGFQESSY